MQNDIQRTLLEEIESRFDKKSDAITHLMDLLSVGKDAVYRRWRGETLLTPNELELLAKHFHISLDLLMSKDTNNVLVGFNALKSTPESMLDYLIGIKSQIESVRQLPNGSFYYASQDIPVFYYMYFPELICFKLYIWGLTSWGLNYLKDRDFSLDLLAHPLKQEVEKITNLYNTVPSVELWSLGIVNNTLNQIEYVATIDRFKNSEDALMLCDKLLEMNSHMKKMAEEGCKFSPGSKPTEQCGQLDLYSNELVSTNNMFLVDSDTHRFAVATYCNPNYFYSTDKNLVDFTDSWLKRIIGQSNYISKNSAKSRNWFFSQLKKRILAVRQRIEILMV